MSSLGYVRESGKYSPARNLLTENSLRTARDGKGTADGTIMRTDHQRKVPEVIGKYNLYNKVRTHMENRSTQCKTWVHG